MNKHSSRPPVPCFEPETIAAAARKRRGDDEKVPTTYTKELHLHGITISSRYGKAHEYEVMTEMVEALLPSQRKLVESLWCDSNATACYLVQLKSCTEAQALKIGQRFEDACMKADHGHNGITLEVQGGDRLDINPNWDDDLD